MTKRFKNHNINVRFDTETIAEIKAGNYSEIEALSWELEDVDCRFIGDEYCISNFAMGATIYSDYADKTYMLNLNDIDELLMQGKTLKLYAGEPDDYDREILESEAY